MLIYSYNLLKLGKKKFNLGKQVSPDLIFFQLEEDPRGAFRKTDCKMILISF